MIHDNITDLVEEMLNKQMFEYDENVKCFVKNKKRHSAIGLEESDNKVFIRVDFLEELISELILNILKMQRRDIEENIRKFDLRWLK